MITKIFKIALRNVLKNKRRTFLNVLTIGLNVFIILYGLGMMKGQFDSMFEKIINLGSGHFKIYNKDYVDEKTMMPLDVNIKNPDEVIKRIEKIPYFKGATKRIVHTGIISNTKKKLNVVITGVDMKKEKELFETFSNIKGSVAGGGSSGVVVGKKLSELLDVEEGNRLLLFSQTRQSANNLVDVNTTGIYSNGYKMMEKTKVFIPLKYAESFMDMDNMATEIVVMLDKSSHVAAAGKQLASIIENEFPGLVLLDWQEENPDLIEMARMKYANMIVIILVLVFLAVFIITNTLTMAVFERIPEIGTIRAIGMGAGQVRLMFLMEGVVLGLFGLIAGYIMAGPLIYYLSTTGIILPAESMESFDMPMDATMKAVTSYKDYIFAAVVCFAAGIIGSIMPARRAAKVNIVKALKKGVR